MSADGSPSVVLVHGGFVVADVFNQATSQIVTA